MDTRKAYIGMLVEAAEKKYARKEAIGPGAFLLLDAASRSAGAGAGVVMESAKGVASMAIPIACMYLFGKYLAIPAFAGYAMGSSLAKSTSPSKHDLEAAENNALAKETLRRTQLLEKMPTVTPQQRNKDMMTRRTEIPSFEESF